MDEKMENTEDWADDCEFPTIEKERIWSLVSEHTKFENKNIKINQFLVGPQSDENNPLES
jgi:hypothetical protein